MLIMSRADRNFEKDTIQMPLDDFVKQFNRKIILSQKGLSHLNYTIVSLYRNSNNDFKLWISIIDENSDFGYP